MRTNSFLCVLRYSAVKKTFNRRAAEDVEGFKRFQLRGRGSLASM